MWLLPWPQTAANQFFRSIGGPLPGPSGPQRTCKSLLACTWASALFLATALIVVNASPLQGQAEKLYVPALRPIDTADLGIALVNPTLTEARVTLTARSYDGAIIQKAQMVNPVTVTLPGSGQIASLASELFRSGISGQTGWVEISASTPAVRGFFSVFDSRLSFIDAAEFAKPAQRLIFPHVATTGSSPTELSLVNTASRAIGGTISLYENSGRLFATQSITMPPLSGFTRSIDELVPSATPFEGYVVVDSGLIQESGMVNSLIGFETYRDRADIALIHAFPESASRRIGFLPHFASQGGISATLTLVNFSQDSQVLRITSEGLKAGRTARTPSSVTVERTLPPNARLREGVEPMFNLSGDMLIDGYIRFETETNTRGVIGFLDYGSREGALAAVEAQAEGYSDLFFPQVAEGGSYYTGLALLNPNSESSIVTLDAFAAGGSRTGSTIVNLKPGEREARLLSEFLQLQINQVGGYLRLTATRPIFALGLFGSRNSLTFLASVPGQGEALRPQVSGRIVKASLGANVISDDGSTSLLIPPGALASDAPIKVAAIRVADFAVSASDQQALSAAQATPAGTQLQIPARLTFPLNADLDPGTQLPLLTFDPKNGNYQKTNFIAIVDDSGRTASAEVTYFSQFVALLSRSELSTISNVSPPIVSPGDVVTITFNESSAETDQYVITFAGPNNTSIQATVLAASATSFQVRVPDGAVSGLLIVRMGSRSSVGFPVTVLTPTPPPGTISISPSTAVVGTSSVEVEIAGTAFVPKSIVNYDGNTIYPTFIDNTLLRITLLGAQLNPGFHRMYVFNPASVGGASNTVEFTVMEPLTNNAPSVNAGPNQTGVVNPRSVTLVWDPNRDSFLAGYNLYRSEQSGMYGIRLNVVLLTSTTFSDSTVLAGHTYFYVVKAVAVDGTESGPSNEVSITR
jgi:hypothetical protein